MRSAQCLAVARCDGYGRTINGALFMIAFYAASFPGVG
jgi:hypothetical protein